MKRRNLLACSLAVVLLFLVLVPPRQILSKTSVRSIQYRLAEHRNFVSALCTWEGAATFYNEFMAVRQQTQSAWNQGD